MEQIGVVKDLLPGGRMQVAIQRKSACSGECDSCGSCAHPEQLLVVEAQNSCGAHVGESVVLCAHSQQILSLAALVYILPVVLMIGFYFLPLPGEGLRILASLAGLCAGVAVCIFYGKWVGKAKTQYFEVKRKL